MFPLLIHSLTIHNMSNISLLHDDMTRVS